MSEHVYFTTDEIALKISMRVDGKLSLNEAMTPEDNGDTQSAVVILDTL
jgi:hypothetical protein